MKKLLAMLLALCMVFALCACGQTAAPAQTDAAPAQTDAAPAAEPVNITLWTYPIGGWGNADTVDALIAAWPPDPRAAELLSPTRADTGRRALPRRPARRP